VFESFCRQAGIARCDTLGTLCETLKLFHTGGPLPGRKVLVMGASGGDMAMTADVSRELDLDFAPLSPARAASLREVLTDRVTIANPFDIHTYLWFDPPALKRVFTEVLHSGYDAAGFMLDSPPEGKADSAAYDAVIDVFIEAAHAAPTRAALIASLPETISPRIRQRCLDGGVIPLQGQREALEALSLAGGVGAAWNSNPSVQLHLPPLAASAAAVALSEHEGKTALADFGVRVPRGKLVPTPAAAEAALALGFPVVIKASGAHLEHKTEVGGVVLNIRTEIDARNAAERLAKLSDTILVEEMFADGVAEILIGVIVDPQFGQVLVLGSGGIFTEIMSDSVSLLPPWKRASIESALQRLTIRKLFSGYRGKAAADVDALIGTILSVASYASANVATLVELDVNPVIVRPVGLGAVAVDAMIRLKKLL
jgi:acetate---CoA ligase (ADP-forming)